MDDLRHGVFLDEVAVRGWAAAFLVAILVLFLDGLPFGEFGSTVVG